MPTNPFFPLNIVLPGVGFFILNDVTLLFHTNIFNVVVATKYQEESEVESVKRPTFPRVAYFLGESKHHKNQSCDMINLAYARRWTNKWSKYLSADGLLL